MTGMTPERLADIRRNLPSADVRDAGMLSRRERDAFDLLAEVERLRAGIEALTEDPTWHRGMYGCPRDMVSTDRLLALLNPTEGETDG